MKVEGELLDRNAVLGGIYRTGRVMLPDGSTAPALEHGLPLSEGEQLYALVSQERPTVTLEVGLAHGKSTLFICQALADLGNEARHIAMDRIKVTIRADRIPGCGIWRRPDCGIW